MTEARVKLTPAKQKNCGGGCWLTGLKYSELNLAGFNQVQGDQEFKKQPKELYFSVFLVFLSSVLVVFSDSMEVASITLGREKIVFPSESFKSLSFILWLHCPL